MNTHILQKKKDNAKQVRNSVPAHEIKKTLYQPTRNRCLASPKCLHVLEKPIKAQILAQ